MDKFNLGGLCENAARDDEEQILFDHFKIVRWRAWIISCCENPDA